MYLPEIGERYRIGAGYRALIDFQAEAGNGGRRGSIRENVRAAGIVADYGLVDGHPDRSGTCIIVYVNARRGGEALDIDALQIDGFHAFQIQQWSALVCCVAPGRVRREDEDVTQSLKISAEPYKSVPASGFDGIAAQSVIKTRNYPATWGPAGQIKRAEFVTTARRREINRPSAAMPDRGEIRCCFRVRSHNEGCIVCHPIPVCTKIFHIIIAVVKGRLRRENPTNGVLVIRVRVANLL